MKTPTHTPWCPLDSQWVRWSLQDSGICFFKGILCLWLCALFSGCFLTKSPVVCGLCIRWAVFTAYAFSYLLLEINLSFKKNVYLPFLPLRCMTSRETCRMEVRWWYPLYLKTSATASWNPWSSMSWTLWTPSCRGRRDRVHTTPSLSPSNFLPVSHYLPNAHL